MYFTLKNSAEFQYTPQFGYRSESITPFPFNGKFRVRIVGYDYASSTNALNPYFNVYSRALLNPCMPTVFSFIPATAGNTVRTFHRSGWWEVELSSGGIDLLVMGSDGFAVPAYTLLIHIELERL